MEKNNTVHTVFQNDPIQLKNYVNKFVEVSKSNGKTSKGTVLTIDPVSESVLLAVQEDQKIACELVSGHAVTKIELVEPPQDYKLPDDSLCTPKATMLSLQSIKKQKLRVKEYLNQNRLPVTEVGDQLMIENVVTINPPYYPEHVMSSNEMVLERVQNLIRNMTPSQT